MPATAHNVIIQYCQYMITCSPNNGGRETAPHQRALEARQRPLISTVVEDNPRNASTPHIEFCHDVLTAF